MTIFVLKRSLGLLLGFDAPLTLTAVTNGTLRYGATWRRWEAVVHRSAASVVRIGWKRPALHATHARVAFLEFLVTSLGTAAVPDVTVVVRRLTLGLAGEWVVNVDGRYKRHILCDRKLTYDVTCDRLTTRWSRPRPSSRFTWVIHNVTYGTITSLDVVSERRPNVLDVVGAKCVITGGRGPAGLKKDEDIISTLLDAVDLRALTDLIETLEAADVHSGSALMATEEFEIPGHRRSITSRRFEPRGTRIFTGVLSLKRTDQRPEPAAAISSLSFVISLYYTSFKRMSTPLLHDLVALCELVAEPFEVLKCLFSCEFTCVGFTGVVERTTQCDELSRLILGVNTEDW